MPDTDLTQLNSSINTFLKIIKGKVNDKDFSYDDKGLKDAIEYATQLMRDKKPVNFEWQHDYEKLEKLGPLMGIARVASLAGRAAGKGLKGAGKVGFEVASQPLPTINKQNTTKLNAVELEKFNPFGSVGRLIGRVAGPPAYAAQETASVAGRIAGAGITGGPKGAKRETKKIVSEEKAKGRIPTPAWKPKPLKIEKLNEIKDNSQKSIQKIDPAMAALAGWWLGGTVDELNQQRARLSPSQQNEFDRQIERALMRGRGFRKDISLEKLQSLFKTKPISPGTAAPPKAGLSWDPTSHRWVNPKTKIQGAISARKGKKRTRGTGTGVGEKKVKVGTRMIGAGRRFKGETDVAVKRKKIKIPTK